MEYFTRTVCCFYLWRRACLCAIAPGRAIRCYSWPTDGHPLRICAASAGRRHIHVAAIHLSTTHIRFYPSRKNSVVFTTSFFLAEGDHTRYFMDERIITSIAFCDKSATFLSLIKFDHKGRVLNIGFVPLQAEQSLSQRSADHFSLAK